MKEPTISVAMATYNGERFLQEQLDSLARQMQLPCELVACDDGSTDGTLDVLQRFAADAPFPVSVYQNPERLGCVRNFLKAVEMCKGDLIAFCDQDDVWLPRKLAVCAGQFDSERVSMVIHLAMLCGPNLEPLGRTWPYLGIFQKECPEVPSLQYMDVGGMAMVFRRRVPEPLWCNPQLYENLLQGLSGHDPLVRFMAGAFGAVVPLRQVLALHRCHGSNLSGTHDTGSVTGPAYVFSVRGLRARIFSPARWLKAHMGLADRTGWHSYSNEAVVLREKSEALRCAATCAEGRLRARLERSTAALSRRTDALVERSLLYQESPGKARARFCGMILRGRYQARSRGGLGLWSLAKDCMITFRPSRAQFAERRAEDLSVDRFPNTDAQRETQ